MKKSVMFLINGLGVEKAGSYNILLEDCMPNLFRIRETSYFTTAITASLEERSAYQRFFLGDTYKSEVEFLKNYIQSGALAKNPTFMGLKNNASNPETKLHIFLEPTDERVTSEINALYDALELDLLEKDATIESFRQQYDKKLEEYEQLESKFNDLEQTNKDIDCYNSQFH